MDKKKKENTKIKWFFLL